MDSKKQESANAIIDSGLEFKMGALTNLAAAPITREITPTTTITLTKFFILTYPLSGLFLT
jgi:hypothetical protein